MEFSIKSKTVLSLLFAAIVVSSCQPNDEWYLGEWEADDGTSFTLTNSTISSSSFWEGVDSFPIKFEKREGGGIDVVAFDPETGEEMESINGVNMYLYEETHEILLTQDLWEQLYHKKTVQIAEASKGDKNVDKKGGSKTPDKAWKSAFDYDGYLVLKSEDQFTNNIIRQTSYYYVVLKGYGANYKRGKVTFHFGSYIRYVGIYDYDDGVLIFPELYTATGYPADDIAIEGRIFNVEFSPSISITEYKEPYGNAVTTIKYRQTNSGDYSGYKQSSNPHPRNR